MSGDTAVLLVLLVPALTAAILALVPDHRLSTRLNVAACAVTFVGALVLRAIFIALGATASSWR